MDNVQSSRRHYAKEPGTKTGLPDFFIQHTKTGKNIPNAHESPKIYQMAVKYTKFL
jgi:hypothetical protein